MCFFSYPLRTLHLRTFVPEVEHRLRTAECHRQRNKGASNKTQSEFPSDFFFGLRDHHGDSRGVRLVWQNMLTLPLGDDAKGSVVQGHSLLQSTFEDNL